MALSTTFKQFIALFVKQCNPAFPSTFPSTTSGLISRELWTTVPSSLTDEAKRHQDLLSKWGFTVSIDFPHSGNGFSVSPNGEVDLYWKNGKIDESALVTVIGDIQIVKEYSVSYIGDYIRIKV